LALGRNQETTVKRAKLLRADIVAEIEGTLDNDFLAKQSATLNFSKKLHLETEQQIGPEGGIETFVIASEFVVPGMDKRGRASRIENFDSEEGNEAPWPQDELGGTGAGEGESIYTTKALDVIQSVNREIQNMRAPVNRLFKFVKKNMATSGTKDFADDQSSKSSKSSHVA